MTNSGRKTLILPWQRRWLARGQTEGSPAIVRVTPLRPALRPRHLPFQGRMVENHPSPSFPRRREPNSLPGRRQNFERRISTNRCRLEISKPGPKAACRLCISRDLAHRNPVGGIPIHELCEGVGDVAIGRTTDHGYLSVCLVVCARNCPCPAPDTVIKKDEVLGGTFRYRIAYGVLILVRDTLNPLQRPPVAILGIPVFCGWCALT